MFCRLYVVYKCTALAFDLSFLQQLTKWLQHEWTHCAFGFYCNWNNLDTFRCVSSWFITNFAQSHRITIFKLLIQSQRWLSVYFQIHWIVIVFYCVRDSSIQTWPVWSQSDIGTIQLNIFDGIVFPFDFFCFSSFLNNVHWNAFSIWILG